MNALSRSTVLVLLFAAAALAEPASNELRLAPGSKLWIDGDSNFCSYQVQAGKVELTAMAEAQDVRGLRAVIPVRELSSGNGILDANLRRALKSEENPVITLEIPALRVEGAPGSQTAQAQGELTMAGVTRPLAFGVKVQREGPVLHLVGELPLRMSDFRVQPPVVMGGLIRAHDDVRVHLDVRISNSAAPAAMTMR